MKQNREAVTITAEQVNHCIRFIDDHMENTPSIRHKHTSYFMKHCTEQMCKELGTPCYIPEQAFIAAITNLGIPSNYAGTGNSIHVALKLKEEGRWKRQ